MATNLTVCDSIDRPVGYYAKWNNLDGEGQMFCNSTYMWKINNKISKSNKSETSLQTQRTKRSLPEGIELGVENK